MRNSVSELIPGLLILMTVGCAGRFASTCPELENVVLSVANEDIKSPIALMQVEIDGVIAFKGVVATATGQFSYVTTRVPTDRGVLIKATSSTDDGGVTVEKEVWIKNGIWIVITRERGFGDAPSLDISVSYENHQAE